MTAYVLAKSKKCNSCTDAVCCLNAKNTCQTVVCGSLNVSLLAYVQETGAAVNSRFKQTRPRSLRWIFFEVLLLLYTMQGDLVPVVLISQL